MFFFSSFLFYFYCTLFIFFSLFAISLPPRIDAVLILSGRYGSPPPPRVRHPCAIVAPPRVARSHCTLVCMRLGPIIIFVRDRKRMCETNMRDAGLMSEFFGNNARLKAVLLLNFREFFFRVDESYSRGDRMCNYLYY